MPSFVPGGALPGAASAEPVDFRPLPPARGTERAVMPAPAPTEVAAQPGRRGGRRDSALALIVLAGLALALFAAVSTTGVRIQSGAAALATPALGDVTLPYTEAQLAALRAQAAQSPSAAQWVALGNALFDNLEVLREQSPLSAQYLTAAQRWPEASAAYRAALALHDDPATRLDLALTLVYYGGAVNDPASLAAGLAEAERAWSAGAAAPALAPSYGLVLVALNPPRTAVALAVWQAAVVQAPDSPAAQRAQTLLRLYQPQ